MHFVYIALMVLGLIGMIACSKKQKTNPAMQPVAFVLFIVVVINAALLLYDLGIFGGARNSLLRNEMAFYASQGNKVGTFLKEKAPGKKVLLVTDAGFETNDSVKRLAEALRDGYQGEVVVDTVNVPGNETESGAPLYMIMKASDFDALVEKYSDCGIIVSAIGLPSDMGRLKFIKQPADKRPVLFLMGLPSGPMPGLYQALQSDMISGVTISNPDAIYDTQAPRNPLEAFDVRYVLVSKDNSNDFRKQLTN